MIFFPPRGKSSFIRYQYNSCVSESYIFLADSHTTNGSLPFAVLSYQNGNVAKFSWTNAKSKLSL
jgi:hypothetical protein